MDIWTVLGIEKTTDTKVIKRAYAKMLKIYHPEDDSEGFMRIRKAYEAALEYAESGREDVEFHVSDAGTFEDDNKHTRENILNPEEIIRTIDISKDERSFPQKEKEQLLEKVETLYSNVFKRREVKYWQELFAELTVDEYHYLDEKAWNFFNKNCSLPYEVWKFIDAEFSISEDPRFICTKFVKFDYGVPFDCFDPNLDIDYSSYVKFRFKVFEVFCGGDYQETVKLAQDAEKIYNGDYFVYKIKGISLYFLHNYHQAIEALSKALSLNDSDLELLLYRGNAFLKYGQYKKASIDFKSVLLKETDNLEALKGMIMCLFNMKKYGAAGRYFRRFINKSSVGDFQISILLEEYEKKKLINKLRKILNIIRGADHKLFNGERAFSYMLVFFLIACLVPPVLFLLLTLPVGFSYAGVIVILYLLSRIFRRKTRK